MYAFGLWRHISSALDRQNWQMGQLLCYILSKSTALCYDMAVNDITANRVKSQCSELFASERVQEYE